jgi:hypothetical protein
MMHRRFTCPSMSRGVPTKAAARPSCRSASGPVLPTRNPAGRTPGVPLRLARLFHRTIGQAPRAHEVQDMAAQGPAQPGAGRWRPPTAVTVHRPCASAQERSYHRSVAGVGGQEECHLRLVADREPCGGLGLLFRVEGGVVTLAARRLPIVAGNARRADVHNFRSLPGAACGQRAAWMPKERWSDMGGPTLEVAVRFTATSRVQPRAHQPGRARHARVAGGERAAPTRPSPAYGKPSRLCRPLSAGCRGRFSVSAGFRRGARGSRTGRRGRGAGGCG